MMTFDGEASELPGLVTGTLVGGAYVSDPYVWLSDAAQTLAPDRRVKLITALVRALEQRAEIARVYDVAALPAACPPIADESLDALVCRSVAPGFGQLYIVPERGSFFDPDYTPGEGTSHGSPYLYDRSVPVIARAPGRIPAGVVVDEPQLYATFTRTAASLLGLPPPGDCVEALDLTTRPEVR
jgi:hypothetical protein